MAHIISKRLPSSLINHHTMIVRVDYLPIILNLREAVSYLVPFDRQLAVLGHR